MFSDKSIKIFKVFVVNLCQSADFLLKKSYNLGFDSLIMKKPLIFKPIGV